jgi:hypothetical protein
MLSERAPFGNVAVMADNDRMYHRIGPIGDPDAVPPRISASAQIQPAGDGNWAIVESGEVRATYPDVPFACPYSGRQKFETRS